MDAPFTIHKLDINISRERLNLLDNVKQCTGLDFKEYIMKYERKYGYLSVGKMQLPAYLK